MKPVSVLDRFPDHLVVEASRVRIISGDHNNFLALPSLGALLPVCSDYLLTRTSFPLTPKHLDEQIAGHRAENLVGVAALRRSGIVKSRRVHIEDLDGIPSERLNDGTGLRPSWAAERGLNVASQFRSPGQSHLSNAPLIFRRQDRIVRFVGLGRIDL